MQYAASMKSIHLAEKLALFDEHFQPRTVGQFNGHDLIQRQGSACLPLENGQVPRKMPRVAKRNSQRHAD